MVLSLQQLLSWSEVQDFEKCLASFTLCFLMSLFLSLLYIDEEVCILSYLGLLDFLLVIEDLIFDIVRVAATFRFNLGVVVLFDPVTL